MKNRDIYWRRYKIQKTLYLGQWHLYFLQSRHLGTSHSSPSILFHCSKHSAKSFVGIAISCPIIFSWISSTFWNLFPFKGDFSFGKSQSRRAPDLGCRGAESPEWFDVSPKTSAQDVMCERPRCHDEAASHQLPIAVAFWIIWIVSVEECSSLTQNLMHICCSTHSVILNVMATQYTCCLLYTSDAADDPRVV